MRTRGFFHFETTDSAQRRPTLDEQMSATTYMSFEARSLMPLCHGLFDPGETGRATARLQMGFDRLYCKLDRLCDPMRPQPTRRRTMAIRWEETNGLLLAIDVNIFAIHESSSAKEHSATEHASFPAQAAYSHARPCIAETNPATGFAWSQGHSNRPLTN